MVGWQDEAVIDLLADDPICSNICSDLPCSHLTASLIRLSHRHHDETDLVHEMSVVMSMSE